MVLSRFRSLVRVGAIVVAIGTPGCVLLESSGSGSDSSGSLSDSSGSISDSSSSSSDGDDTAYRQDVHDFTVALASAQGQPDELRRGLSEIALARGVSDWEAIESTFVSVGVGLAHVLVDAGRLRAYQLALAPDGSPQFDAIGSSYEAARR